MAEPARPPAAAGPSLRVGFVDGLTRQSLPFLLGSRVVRRPSLRVGAQHPTARLVVQGLTRATRAFREHWHRRGALLVHLDAAQLEHFDLAGCDLSGFRLAGADLRRAYLRGCQLSHASLFRTVLEGADLTDARLRHADLREADLGGALLVRSDLRGARLDGARLRYADLRGARLSGTVLRGADLTGAYLDPDFSEVTVASDATTLWPVTATRTVRPRLGSGCA